MCSPRHRTSRSEDRSRMHNRKQGSYNAHLICHTSHGEGHHHIIPTIRKGMIAQAVEIGTPVETVQQVEIEEQLPKDGSILFEIFLKY